MLSWIESIGKAIRDGVEWAGAMATMFLQAIGSGFRRPLGIYDIFYQVVALGVRSMPLATLMGVFVGMAQVISDEFASSRDWPMASAVAVALLLLLVVPMMLYTHFEAKAQERKAMEP